MRWLTRWRLRLRSLLQRKRVDAELDTELQFYLDHVIETHVSARASKADAVAAARRSMGPHDQDQSPFLFSETA